jgi:hypothetical protein
MFKWRKGRFSKLEEDNLERTSISSFLGPIRYSIISQNRSEPVSGATNPSRSGRSARGNCGRDVGEVKMSQVGRNVNWKNAGGQWLVNSWLTAIQTENRKGNPPISGWPAKGL